MAKKNKKTTKKTTKITKKSTKDVKQSMKSGSTTPINFGEKLANKLFSW